MMMSFHDMLTHTTDNTIIKELIKYGNSGLVKLGIWLSQDRL